MCLHIEDERDRALFFLNSWRLGGLDCQHVKEFSEHLVHGQKRYGHTAGGFQKVSAIEAQLPA